MLEQGGLVTYVVATVTPLDNTQQLDLENIKKIARNDFEDKMAIEAINLHNLYNTIGAPAPENSLTVELPCKFVEVSDRIFIGATSVSQIFGMMQEYKQKVGMLDAIYDRNIRKYLSKRIGSVNDGIHKTLDEQPERFITYNNGITIVCQSAQTTATGLILENPYIVNGCQTTRTLYTFMDTKFPGQNPRKDSSNKMKAYHEAYLAFKIVEVKDALSSDYAKDITRYSNKQNSVRGKDFIALEDLYNKLKKELQKQGYFLETQAGEYDTLPPHVKNKYHKNSHVINSFEATLAYAAAMLNKPYNAFGRSGEFTPSGKEYNEVIENLISDDLLIPWQIMGYASELGYTKAIQRNPKLAKDHQLQTRYFFLYMVFRLVRQTLVTMDKEDTKTEIYKALKVMIEDYKVNSGDESLFKQLLKHADTSIYTYMKLATNNNWYTDRNSFLKQKDLIDDGHIIQATGAAEMNLPDIGKKLKVLMSG